jgi:hypothetical protein
VAPQSGSPSLHNDRPHTIALDPLKHGGEAGAHIDGIAATSGSMAMRSTFSLRSYLILV